MKNACPYCAVVLQKEPKRNSKCPHCHNQIIVRQKQPFFDRPLLTEADALISDEFEMLSSTVTFPVTKESYQATQRELTQRFGTEAGWDDVAWSTYQQLAEMFARQPDFGQLAIVYACMASHMHKRHKPFSSYLEEAFRYQIRNMQQMNFRKVRITAYGYDCSACESLNDKTYKITDDLVENPPLPPLECTCLIDKKLAPGYCICSFAGDDLDMNAWMKNRH